MMKLRSTGTSEIPALDLTTPLAVVDGGTGDTTSLATVKTSLNASGSAPVYGCRAWCTFIGATGAITASGNVTSVTRGAAGNYTVNFTTAMPDAFYSAVVTASQSVSSMAVVLLGQTGPNGNSNNYSAANITTTSLKFVIGTVSSASGSDPDVVHVAIFR